MNITEVSYSMKRSNGNYGSDEVAYTAQIEPGDNPEHAVAKLKLLCEQQLHGEEWAANYRRAQELLNRTAGEGIAPERVEAARHCIAQYEAWANAVGEVRREMMKA